MVKGGVHACDSVFGAADISTTAVRQVKTVHVLSQQKRGTKSATLLQSQASRHIRQCHLLLAYTPPSPPPLTCLDLWPDLERLVEAFIASPPGSASLFLKSQDFKHFLYISAFGGSFSIYTRLTFIWADCRANATVDRAWIWCVPPLVKIPTDQSAALGWRLEQGIAFL